MAASKPLVSATTAAPAAVSAPVPVSRKAPGRRNAAQVRAAAAAKQAKFNRAVSQRVQEILPEAITAKVQELMPQLAEQLAAARVAAGTTVQDSTGAVGDKALLEGLAHAMAKASDPGNRRRIVDPAVMRLRAEADDRMRTLLIDFHAQGRTPVYKVVAKTYLANTLIEPQFQDEATKKMIDQEINWPSIPNQALEPINDEAKAVHKEFLRSISAEPRDRSKDIDTFVMSGGRVLRGRAAPPPNELSEAAAFDPRRAGPSGKPVPRTLAILGSIAEPAVLNQ